MEIEWLRFRVKPECREKFVQQDEKIWTAGLAKYSGFLGKEIWISPDDLTEMIVVIHWESLEAWKSVPAEVLQQLDLEFAAAMDEGTYELLEGKRYQKRRVQVAIE